MSSAVVIAFCYTGCVMDKLIKTTIEGIAAGGAGLARAGGKRIFVEGGIPGETVVCRITEERRSWSQAELVDIEEASADRVQPACSLYGTCGGCNLQHLAYPAQLAAKTAILQDAFARISGFCPPQPLVFPSEPWEYRNRMQFHAVQRRASGVSTLPWGLKSRKSAEIVPVPDCPIADPGIRRLLRTDPQQMQALIPLGKDRFTVYARNGLLLSEGGTSRGRTPVLDRELALDAGAFFQSNGAMLEKLVASLREIAAGIGPSARSLPMADLYCGVGTFAAFLAELFPSADLVEENRAALALARENLAPHGPANFFALRSEHWAQNASFRQYGFIVADPPRQGLSQSLALALAQAGPAVQAGSATLAYVSCDPATLARDSKILLAGGYQLKKLLFYDFYPQTAHIESLAVFEKQGTGRVFSQIH